METEILTPVIGPPSIDTIKEGDNLIVTGGPLVAHPMKAHKVYESTDGDIIILIEPKQKIHFNLNKFFNGESWVKELYIAE